MSKKTTKPKSKAAPKAKSKSSASKMVKKSAASKKSKPAAKKPARPVAKKATPTKQKKAVAKKPVASKPAKQKVQKPVAKTVAPARKAPAVSKPETETAKKPAATHTPAKPANKNMPFQKNEAARQMIAKNANNNTEESGKNRYSDKELEEFRAIIVRKLEEATKELLNLQAQLTAANEHGTDDTASTFKILEDGSDSLAKEEAGQLAGRQKKFIEQLENALIRIENKTYGICRVTGKLIPKERLRAVPHTTQSIEAKLNQYRD